MGFLAASGWCSYRSSSLDKLLWRAGILDAAAASVLPSLHSGFLLLLLAIHYFFFLVSMLLAPVWWVVGTTRRGGMSAHRPCVFWFYGGSFCPCRLGVRVDALLVCAYWCGFLDLGADFAPIEMVPSIGSCQYFAGDCL
jgi:hypothetical protein